MSKKADEIARMLTEGSRKKIDYEKLKDIRIGKIKTDPPESFMFSESATKTKKLRKDF